MALFPNITQILQNARIPPTSGGTVSVNRLGPFSIPVYQPPKPAPVSSPILRNSGYSTPPRQTSTQYYAPPPPPVPSYDIAANQARARQAAEGAVNPYYSKLLDTFLKQEGIDRSLREQAFNLANEQAEESNKLIGKQTDGDLTIKLADLEKNLMDTLAAYTATGQQLEQTRGLSVGQLEKNLTDTLAGFDITKGRTVEDVGTNIANINQQADVYQTDVGTQADEERIALARELSSRGLTGGLGGRARERSQEAQATAEGRQEEAFGQARTEQKLFQSRTLGDLMRGGELATTRKGQEESQINLEAKQRQEDLARSGELAKTKKGQEEVGAKTTATQRKEAAALASKQTKAQAKFDIDSYYAVHGEGYAGAPRSVTEEARRAEIDKQNREALAVEERKQQQRLFEEFVQSLIDPARMTQARNAYGSFL